MAVANLAGVVAPWLTGVAVEKTGTFYLAFLIAAGVLVAGSLTYAFVIGPVEPVAWRQQGARAALGWKS